MFWPDTDLTDKRASCLGWVFFELISWFLMKFLQNSGSQNRPIRIANIMEEGRFSGQHKRILSVAERLRPQGIETVVYFPTLESEFFEERLRESGIDYRRMNITRPTKELKLLARYIFFFLPEVFVLSRQITKDRVDIVHCNGSWQVKGALAAKLARGKVVWHLNDTKRPPIIKGIFSLCAVALADFFVVAGRRVKAYYLDRAPLRGRPYEIIQAPVDTKKYAPSLLNEKSVLSAFRGLNILTIANVNPVKGLEHFIDMARILSARFDNLHFHVVGSIYERQLNYFRKLEKRIQGYGLRNVHFHGFAAQIEDYLREADIFVCSSLYEASPTSVWEAMATGMPIVSTDVGDVGQVLQDGVGGFVVPPGDPEALAEKVGLLIEDRALRQKLGERARAEAVKSLDIDVCVAAHSRVYRMVANGRV